jgi:hypothetical protein
VSAEDWKTQATLCVDRFARSLLESPLLNDHPAPLIMQELERIKNEIEAAELPEPAVSPPVHVNGNVRKKARA